MPLKTESVCMSLHIHKELTDFLSICLNVPMTSFSTKKWEIYSEILVSVPRHSHGQRSAELGQQRVQKGNPD